MREVLIRAEEVRVGDWLYDNSTRQWPEVKTITKISAGRLSFLTTGRFFVEFVTDLVLVRKD